ncbi:MAG: LacI family DNA-binding transcriptional regulator [Phycisphaeraceae bacterium]
MSIVAVAKLAGVSHATVSRVINNRAMVAPRTAEQVRKAMAKLNYLPRSVRPGRVPQRKTGLRSGNLGVFIVGRDAVLSWLYADLHQPLLGGIHECAREASVNLIVDAVTSPDRLPPAIVDQQIDGAIVYPIVFPDMELLTLIGRNIPLVTVFTEHHIANHDQVMHDNRGVGQLAGAYLLEQGCRRPAFLNHNPNHISLRSRQRGFGDYLHLRGITPQWFVSDTTDPDGMHMHGERERSDCQILVDRLLAAEQRPDGLFVPGDRYVRHVHHMLSRAGVKPGRDIILVSVDNFQYYLDSLHPRPASFDLNMKEVGRIAAERLIQRIANPHQSLLRMMVPPRLVPGEPVSDGKAPSGKSRDS